ncbi:MAG: two-component sensor histidine kinase [Planctomycetota bacterium]|nr:MAG: two-component sensor histidine kinase [Planctomycetota bacterium]
MPDRSSSSAAAEALDPRILSRLAGGLAHELKNPLSTIGLHLDLLREQWADDPDPKARRSVRMIDTLKQEVGRLDEILQDFLLYARTDQIELEEADLNAVVQRVADFVRPEAAARGIRVETFLAGDLPPLRLDPARFRQVVLNLVINARQAIGDRGGRITLITRRQGGRVLLEVLDDGPGMDEETLASCFEVYFSRKKGGSGLGLPTVRRLVEAHGGSVEIQSSPGHGTRVRVTLPLPPAGGRS